MTSSDMLGTEKVQKLIFNLGWPAALNFLVITIYNITDVIFVGRWLGAMQIGAVVIVGAATFLFSSFGLAIGVGGASMIARALGEKDKRKAAYIFGNQLILVVTFSFLILCTGWVFEGTILRLFGAHGNIFAPANAYYRVLLFGIPFLSLSMMGNNVIQAEGKAKVAMFNSLLPTLLNIVLNPVFIKGFNMGVEGAAWATLISFIAGFLLVLRFFTGRLSEIGFNYTFIKIKPRLAREIVEIGGSMMVNIITTNIFLVLLNKILFTYQQESGVVIYSIVNRVSMFFLIPAIGIDGGIRPIIGYNFGSRQMDRIRDTIHAAMKYGIVIGCVLLGILFVCADRLIPLFTNDYHVITATPVAMKIIFLFSPLMVIEVITVAYFQAIGETKIAFGITILRYMVLLIPLLYILPRFFGYNGVLYAFPVVDILITIPSFWLLRNELNVRLPGRVAAKMNSSI